MSKLDLRLLRRFVALAKPFWISEERWKARGLLALLILLLVGDTQFNVFFNQQSGEFTSALAAGDAPRFWLSIRAFAIWLVVAVPIYAFYYYVRDKLALHWRRWMTGQVLDRYFKNRAYYHLLKTPEIDNPDQRIAEDINLFTYQSLTFLLIFTSAGFQLLAFSRVLWTIAHSLAFILVLYAGVVTFVTFRVFSHKMVVLHFRRLTREADFRFGLVRVRENAESIALYHGERQERDQVQRRFASVFTIIDMLIRWSLRLNFFHYAFSLISMVLPVLVIAPRVLSGELEVGRVVQAAGAFAAVLAALTVLADNMESLSRFAASISRLDVLDQNLAPGQTVVDPERGRIISRVGGQLRFEDVTLQTPNYERTLVKGLTAAVPEGKGLLIVGPSGCGKSSLLRMMAGLWDSGTGVIARPAAEEMLFLPQHAYMILGNLRQQLCYPDLRRDVSDEELTAVLKNVNLPHLAAHCGGFERDLDFEKVLSVGERQRVAFARVLLHRPRYVLLDEATSALDTENEAMLYRQLVSTSTTLVSVSHHPSLVKYHAQVLELTADGGWNLCPAAEFRFTDGMA